MSDDLVERKFHTLVDHRIGQDQAANVFDWIWRLDSADGVSGLFPLLEVRE
jgi:hypothetical protein